MVFLRAGQLDQPLDFGGGKVTPGAGRQRAERDRPDPGADEPANRVADGRHHTADLALTTLVNGDLDIRGVTAGKGLYQPDSLCRRGKAIVQFDPFGQALDGFFGWGAVDRGQIGLGNVITRMGKAVDEGPVVGEKQEALAADIEPAHGPKERLARQVYQLGDRAGGV